MANTKSKKDTKTKQTTAKRKPSTVKTTAKKGSGTKKTTKAKPAAAKKTKSPVKAKPAAANKVPKKKSTAAATRKKKPTTSKSRPATKDTRKKTTTKTTASSKGKATPEESKFWDETMDSLAESAKVLSEEAKKLSTQVSSYSEELFGKIRSTTSEVLKYGQDLTKSAVDRAQEMGEKLKDNYLVGKLNSEKKQLASELGMKLYLEIKDNKNKIPENLLKENKEIAGLLKQIEEIDKKILELANNEKE